MTEEVLNEGVNETPAAEDLRSTITAAIERQRSAPAETSTEEPEAQAQAAPEAAQTEKEQKEARARDEQGRFAAQQKTETPVDQKAATQAQEKPEGTQESPQTEQTTLRPPPGWSPKSKSLFETLPPEVKADIAKREGEVNQGLAKLQEYKGIERFAETAKRSGTTLEGALTNYTNWEGAFMRDPVGTVLHMAGNLKLNPQQFIQALAQKVGGAQPTQQQPGQQPGGADPNMAQIHPALVQKLAQMETTLAAQEAERVAQQRQAVAQNVDTFFADPKNSYADNVSEIMVSLINQAKASGQKIDLPSIYETACWMHPEVRQILINEKAMASPSASNAAKALAADQARSAMKAVTGAPSRGTPPAGGPPANESLRDTIIRNLQAARGA